jgi:hypothetical protein
MNTPQEWVMGQYIFIIEQVLLQRYQYQLLKNRAMNRIYLIIIFWGVYSTVFSQKMENLYKFVIEDSYERMCTSGIINKNDTLYYFCKNCNNKNEYVYDYQINILNQHIRLKMPEVNEHKKHESGFMLLTPEIENQFIVEYSGTKCTTNLIQSVQRF